MTPKEKAQEFFDGFLFQLPTSKAGNRINYPVKFNARLLSILCCQEIMKQLSDSKKDIKINAVIGIDKYFDDKILYWNDVIKEVTKL